MTQTRSPIDNVLAVLSDVKASGGQWSARCPAHDDNRASLSIAVGRDGRVLLHCHAGCTPAAICERAGLTYPGDLFARSNGTSRLEDRIIATYDYDVGPDCLVQQVRLFPKDFRLRHRIGDGDWEWNIKGIDVPLYNAWTLDVARAANLPVRVVEGEKDADAWWDRGHPAVTNVSGAGKWKAGYSGALRGVSRVIIVADRDGPGYAHAWEVYDSVSHVVPDVTVVESDRAKDSAEHFELGGTPDDFRPVSRQDQAEAEAEPAQHVGMGIRVAADVAPERVRWLWPGYIPLGKMTLLDGDPGVAKSTLALDLAARVSTGAPLPHTKDPIEPGGVVLLNAEDGFADTVIPRLIAAGADRSRVFSFDTVQRMDDEGRVYADRPLIPNDVDALAEVVRRTKARLVIVDVLVAFLAAHVNTWRDGDVRRALAPLADMAEATECAILALRHLSKGSAGGPAVYRGGGSIGISGAARSVLMAGGDPTDETGNRRVLAVAKSNLAASATSLSYGVINDPMWAAGRLVWGGISPLSAHDLGWKPKGAREAFRYEEIGDWLLAVLDGEGGEMNYKELRGLALHEGFAERALRDAADRLNIDKVRMGVGRDHKTVWRLPVDKGSADGDAA